MKARLGLVSNSSSASFVLSKDNLPADLLDAVRHPADYAANHGMPNRSYCGDEWDITETLTQIRGRTIMNNFKIGHFLRAIFAARDLDMEDYVTLDFEEEEDD